MTETADPRRFVNFCDKWETMRAVQYMLACHCTAQNFEPTDDENKLLARFLVYLDGILGPLGDANDND